MEKADKIRRIYSIIVGIFAVAMGIALISVAADIYYTGKGSGVVYTREAAAEKLRLLAIPLIILIGAIICGAIFPLQKTIAKHKSEDSLKLLSAKQPSGGKSEQFDTAQKTFAELSENKLNIWIGMLVVAFICAVASLCYLLDAANFKSGDINAEVFAMVKHVLPWVALGFGVLIAATIINGVISSMQLKQLKIMIKYSNGSTCEKSEPQILAKAKNVFHSEVTLWVTRGIIFAVAVAFIIVGIFNGGASDVLIKAINICSECIGLG